MSVIRDIFANESNIDFRPKWRVALAISGALLVLSLGLLLTRGLNLTIDFEGGGVWEVPISTDVTSSQVEAALPAIGDARVQILDGRDGSRFARVQAGTDAISSGPEVVTALSELAGVGTDDVNESTVGPTWGESITEKAIRALILFFFAVAFYLAWRLEWRMAVGALAAVVHDLLITAGLYSLFGFEVSPATVIALLTILGYSLYDTVVVYDKVLENQRGPVGSETSDELVNYSMNQVLMRSINTTITTVLPVLSMLVIGGFFLGGTSLRGFALALFIGLLLGTYSSIFVAAPILVWLRNLAPEAKHMAQAEAARQDRAEASGRFVDYEDTYESSSPRGRDRFDARPRKKRRKGSSARPLR